jgi:hypothetical protein
MVTPIALMMILFSNKDVCRNAINPVRRVSSWLKCSRECWFGPETGRQDLLTEIRVCYQSRFQ